MGRGRHLFDPSKRCNKDDEVDIVILMLSETSLYHLPTFTVR